MIRWPGCLLMAMEMMLTGLTVWLTYWEPVLSGRWGLKDGCPSIMARTARLLAGSSMADPSMTTSAVRLTLRFWDAGAVELRISGPSATTWDIVIWISPEAGTRSSIINISSMDPSLVAMEPMPFRTAILMASGALRPVPDMCRPGISLLKHSIHLMLKVFTNGIHCMDRNSLNWEITREYN